MSDDEINSPLPENLHAEVISTPSPQDFNPHGLTKQKEILPNDSGT